MIFDNCKMPTVGNFGARWFSTETRPMRQSKSKEAIASQIILIILHDFTEN